MQLAAHRGAAELAPENTIPAFEYAIAYDVDYIEIDVQQTLDHRYVIFHDMDVANKTDGTGLFPTLTYDQARALNVADNNKWSGSEYDPIGMPSLEEVLELASDTGVGLYIDLKESVADAAGVANIVARHGMLARSIFVPYVPGRAESILAVQPQATLMLSNQLPDMPPAFFYAASREYRWFGSDTDSYDANDVVALHDGCGLWMPNVYGGNEAANLLEARALGADGAQINLPDVSVAALQRPVFTTLGRNADEVCLTGNEGLGLPRKTLELTSGTLATGRGGCAVVPDGYTDGITFAGDASARASSL